MSARRTAASPAPTLRERQRIARRRRFVECAERLFLRHGYAGTSVNEVVRRAGGSLATLYAEFGTKEKLFEAVIAGRVHSAFTAVEQVQRGRGGTRRFLLALAGRIHARTLSATSLALFRLAVSEGPRLPNVRSAVLDHGLDPFLAHLSGVFAAMHETGDLQVETPLLAAGRFLALVQGQQQFIAACGAGTRLSPATRTRHVAQAVDAFLALHGPVPIPSGDRAAPAKSRRLGRTSESTAPRA